MAKTSKRKQAARTRKLMNDLSSQQQQMTSAIESLTTTVEELPEIRRLLDDVLVAQQRTNQLLELALRAGFDDDERVRSS
jgi:hypothetical protein